MRRWSSAAAGVHAWLLRWRLAIFGALTTHFILAHYFVLGFVTWDGLGHRVPPVVELVQTGAFNHDKFTNWALIEFRPFVELVNVPFLFLFGQDGLYFAFALTIFPLAVLALHAFTRDLTGDPAAAFYACATYVLLPLVNAQLFSGHVDWAIPGFVAFFLHALLLLARSDGPRVAPLAYARFGLAVLLFTNARQQAPYLSVALFVLAGGLFFGEWKDRRPRLKAGALRRIVTAGLVLVIAEVPAVAAQVGVYLRHGTPIYPYQFELLGLKLAANHFDPVIGNGIPMQQLFLMGGLPEYSLHGFWSASAASYFVPARWPYLFYDGRFFGDSVYVLGAILGLPFTIRRMNRETRGVLAILVLLSLAARDFWQVRYAYGIILGACVCNGVALASLVSLADRGRRAPVYLAAVLLLAAHALRPEYEAWRIREKDVYPRMNCAASGLFLPGAFDIQMFPDLGARLLIVHSPWNQFSLPLYGRKLTNRVVTSLRGDIGARCERVRAHTDADPTVLVVDDEDLTKTCARSCAVPGNGRCLAWKMEPEPQSE